MTLTNLLKKATIRTSINYRCVPCKQEPAFVGLADLQNPPHKWHGFRIFAHNPDNPFSLKRLTQAGPIALLWKPAFNPASVAC